MKYTLPVIERTITETAETAESTDTIPLWGIVLIVLISVLLVAVVVLLTCIIRTGKKEIIQEIKVADGERDKRIRRVGPKKEKEEEVHSNLTKKLWYHTVQGDNREVSLLIRDVIKPDKIYRRTLQDYLIIGRRQGDIHIEYDKYISSPHCEFSYEDGILYVRDLESTNGTYLDGKEITKKTVVVNGSIVKLGKTELKVEVIK